MICSTILSRVALAAFVLCGALHATADDGTTTADSLVEAYTPERVLHLPALPNGLKLTGISIAPPPADLRQSDTQSVAIEFSPPESFEVERLLTVVESGETMTVRLLWERVAPAGDAKPAVYSVLLAHQKGYPRFDSTTPPQRPDIPPDAVGAAAWTTHTIESTNSSYPGVFNLFVTAGSQTALVVGQVFVPGVTDSRDDVRAQMETLYSADDIIFAGHIALSRWYGIRIPLERMELRDYTFEVVSSADWVANYEDNTPIAEIEVTRKDGLTETHRLLLGRDTAHTQYSTQASYQVRHRRAPVAWRWRVEDTDLDVEAYVYRGTFPLNNSISPPTSLSIRYLLDEGVLRIRGIALLD